MNLLKMDLSWLVKFVTGHSPWKYQLNKMGLLDSRDCRFCGEEEEKPFHLLYECIGLSAIRYVMYDPDVTKVSIVWKVETILGFTKSMVSTSDFDYQDYKGL